MVNRKFLLLILFLMLSGSCLEGAQESQDESIIIKYRFAKRVRLIIDQYYEVFDGFEKVQVIEGVNVPITDTIKRLLKNTGVSVEDYNSNDYDCTLRIEINGRARGKLYDYPSDYRYSGANVSGRISFDMPETRYYEEEFSGGLSPKPTIDFNSYISPSSAPFKEALEKGNFYDKILKVLYRTYGLYPLIAALNDQDPVIKRETGWAFLNLTPYRFRDYESAINWWEKEGKANELKNETQNLVSDSLKLFLLTHALSDENIIVRLKAVELLGNIKSEKAIRCLINAINDTSKSVRAQIVYSLRKFNKKEVVQFLINILKNDKHPSVRAEAAYSLGSIKDLSAVIPLINSLNDTDEMVRSNAVDALGLLGDTCAVIPLINAFNDKSILVKRNVIHSLEKIKDIRAVNFLINTLNYKEYNLDSDASWALISFGELAIKPLISALNDADCKARNNAANALCRIYYKWADDLFLSLLCDSSLSIQKRVIDLLSIKQDEQSIPLFLEILNNENYLNKNYWIQNYWIQNHAANALCSIIKNVESTELLLSFISNQNFLVRNGASEAISKIGDKRALKPLIYILNNEEYLPTRINAVIGLGNIKDIRAFDHLVKAFNDKESTLRMWALNSMDKIDSLRAKDYLIQALTDPDSSVRRISVELLGKKKAENTIETLLKVALTDSNTFVQKEAWNALINIGKPSVPYLINSMLNMPDSISSALTRIGEPSIEPLIRTANDKNSDIRYYSILTLSRLKNIRALETFLEALKDQDLRIREQAAKILFEMQIKDERSIEPLIMMLKENDLYKYNEIYKFEEGIAEKLLKLIGKPAHKPLIKALNSDYLIIRKNAAKILGDLNISSGNEILALLKKFNIEEFCTSNNITNLQINNMQYYIHMFGLLKDSLAVKDLILALKCMSIQKNYELMEAVVDALSNIGKPAVDNLIEILKDKDGIVRLYAAEILGNINDIRAVEPLIFSLDDQYNDVMSNVAEAIRKITGRDLGYDSQEWRKWWEQNKMIYYKNRKNI